MAGASICCRRAFDFIAEFPDLNSCAREYEQNYQEYAANLGIPNAQYMTTSPDEDLKIGYNPWQGGFREGSHSQGGEYQRREIIRNQDS